MKLQTQISKILACYQVNSTEMYSSKATFTVSSPSYEIKESGNITDKNAFKTDLM